MKIVIVFIIYFIYNISALDCQIDITNNLTVPQEGCTLPSAGNKETLVNTLTLNGPLLINTHNHLKYKSIVCDENKSEIRIQSNYEKIVFEDVETQACLNPCKTSVVFQSKSLNTKYEIKGIENMQELTLIQDPITLFNGVKVMIYSQSGNSEYAEVSKVVGNKVILKSKILNSHLPFDREQEQTIVKFPSLVVLDENRAVFKNNCFSIKPKFTSELKFSSGGMFIDLKLFEYFDYITDEEESKLKDSIFLNTRGITTINANCNNIIFTGNQPQIVLNMQRYERLQNLSFLNMKDTQLSFLSQNGGYTYLKNHAFVNFNGKIKREEIEIISFETCYFQNSNIIFEGLRDEITVFESKTNVLISTSFQQENNKKFSYIKFQDTYFSGKGLDLTNIVVTQNMFIEKCSFNGRGLKSAIQLQDEDKLTEQLNLHLEKCVFFNFIDQETTLITSTAKPTLSQDSAQNQIKYNVLLYVDNVYNLNLNDLKKVVYLPKSEIKCQDGENSSYCHACESGYELDYLQKCVACQKGQLFDLEYKSCIQCDYNCEDCFTNKRGCKKCKTGYTLKSGICTKECQSKQYNSNGQCLSCHQTCQECLGPSESDCKSCPKGFALQNQKCIALQCSSVQFIFNQQCENCFDQQNTKGCFGPYPHSHTCDQGSFVELFTKDCKNCDEQCMACEYYSSNCTLCQSGYNLINGKCNKKTNENSGSTNSSNTSNSSKSSNSSNNSNSSNQKKQPSSSSSQELGVGAIVGIVVGSITVLSYILIIVICKRKIYKQLANQIKKIGTNDKPQTSQDIETNNQLDTQAINIQTQ